MTSLAASKLVPLGGSGDIHCRSVSRHVRQLHHGLGLDLGTLHIPQPSTPLRNVSLCTGHVAELRRGSTELTDSTVPLAFLPWHVPAPLRNTSFGSQCCQRGLETAHFVRTLPRGDGCAWQLCVLAQEFAERRSRKLFLLLCAWAG